MCGPLASCTGENHHDDSEVCSGSDVVSMVWSWVVNTSHDRDVKGGEPP